MATLSTTGGEETEQKEFVRNVSTILRLVTSKDRDFLIFYDKVHESPSGIKGSSISRKPVYDHEDESHGGKVKCLLCLEQNMFLDFADESEKYHKIWVFI